MRRFIIILVALCLISFMSSLAMMLLPPDSGGMAHDTYGLQPYGLRGLYESCQAMGYGVERGLAPPPLGLGADDRSVLVIWNPDPRILASEKEHLQQLGDWVAQGGQVVIGLPMSEDMDVPFLDREEEKEGEDAGDDPLEILFSALGVASPMLRYHSFQSDVPIWLASFWEQRLEKKRSEDVQVSGCLTALGEAVTVLRLPDTGIQVLDGFETGDRDPAGPDGVLAIEDGPCDLLQLVACYHVGQGRVTLVSDPSLFVNSLLLRDDNGVLAISLLGPGTERIVFDEFFHGLSIRGNTLWLLTRMNFGNLFAALLVLALLLIWRYAVVLGPPRPEREKPRRTVTEYVDAMASLFQRGDCRHFVVQELADGVRWSMRRKLHLGHDGENTQAICTALARRDAAEAERFRRMVERLEEIAQSRKQPDDTLMIECAREVSKWL